MSVAESEEAIDTVVAAALEPVGSTWILRRALVLLDFLAVAVPWLVAVAVHGTIVGQLALPIVVGVTVVLLAATQHLYRTRVCAVRSVEIALIGRVVLLSTLVGVALAPALADGVPSTSAVVAGLASFVLLVISRGAFGVWLRVCRAGGRYRRPVALFGTNDEAFELFELLEAQPDLGYEVRGVIGRAPDDRWTVPWLGEVAGAAEEMKARGLNGAVMAVSAFSVAERAAVVNDLLAAGMHVHVSTGMSRIDHRRLRATPLSREPLYYVEPCARGRLQVIGKRALDLVGATLIGIVALPIVLVAGLAIRLESRGPVFYKQTRVGRYGRPFTVYKLRTMIVDADKHLDTVMERNERIGPLFKLERDPRITRVGGILRTTSIDELPQLWCVLLGTMSLVGPRPALPDEVAQFDAELRNRVAVRPGLTGLWQVEARDNPSFHPYRRLDLFYVENWTIALDLAVLVATVETLLIRIVVGIRGRLRERSTGPQVVSTAVMPSPVDP